MDADGVHATTGGPCGHCLSARGRKGPILWQDEHFVVVHKGAPCGVVGHFMLVSKRHFQGPSLMTDAEAAALGPALKRCEAAVEKATKCDRVYTAALGSKGAPHFHAHMMPLYVGDSGAGDAPKAVTGSSWDVFLQEKLAADGAVSVDEQQCLLVSQAFRAEMIRTAPESYYQAAAKALDSLYEPFAAML